MQPIERLEALENMIEQLAAELKQRLESVEQVLVMAGAVKSAVVIASQKIDAPTVSTPEAKPESHINYGFGIPSR